MPGTFDGIGARIVASSLSVQINHETSDASISEVSLDLVNLQSAIQNVISTGNVGGVSFVESARQAYDRWSDDGGASWTATSDSSTTSFSRFCSGQSYEANTFGEDRGFADDLYITGEEVTNGSLFVVDLDGHDFYELSGVTGSAPGGIGGMPFDAYENAALLDTGENNHVAILLSPDGGTQIMKLYIGEKGKDTSGNASSSFLARNGLAYGSYYFLNDTLPTIVGSTSFNAFFDTSTAGALASSKLEDVDTNPADPSQVVLGDQTSGLFVFDFDLIFTGAGFDSLGSRFSITKLESDNASGTGSFNNQDNVDWSEPGVLGTVAYPEGLIFINEDSSEGEIWTIRPDGTELTRIGSTTDDVESTGILDVSRMLGYEPGSIVLTNNQGSNSSLTVLIHPDATLALPLASADSCTGDGGDQLGCTNCPCMNNAAPGLIGGCRNSSGDGTRLIPFGDPSVSLPVGSNIDLRFGASGLPASAFCILNSGDGVAPGNMVNPCFGLNSGVQAVQFDGLRCAIVNTRRHGGRSADTNGKVGVTNNPWGGEGGPPVGIAQAGSGYVAGQTRYFQIINRDDPLLVCMRGLNTSQAVEVTFTP